MGVDQEMRLFNLLYKIIQKLQNPLQQKGDVYWNNSTWTCPADGFITLRSRCASSAAYVLLYISNKDGEIVASLYGEGSGGTFTTMFPVFRGEKYKTAYAIGYNGINAFYASFGG